MKARSILFAISVVANVVLLALALDAPERRPTSGPAASSTRPNPKPDSATSVAVVEADPSPVSVSRPSMPLWTTFETTDLRTLMRQLVAAGFPRRVAAAIVTNRIDAQRDANFATILGDETQLPYWRLRNTRYNPQTRARLYELSREEFTLRHEIGSETFFDDEGARAMRAFESGITDPAKQKLLFDIHHDHSDVLFMTAAMNAAPEAQQASRQASRFVIQEWQADIAAALTPEEFAEYEIRLSATATQLRTTLGEFRASEEEYRALYAACDAIPRPVSTAAEPPRLTNEQLVAQARTVLSPERFAEFQQALAPGAEKLNRLVARLGLPLSAAIPVHAAQRALKERADTVRKDPNLTAGQKHTALAAIAGEATQTITAELGARGFAAYREYDGGWIGELTTPATRP